MNIIVVSQIIIHVTGVIVYPSTMFSCSRSDWPLNQVMFLNTLLNDFVSVLQFLLKFPHKLFSFGTAFHAYTRLVSDFWTVLGML